MAMPVVILTWGLGPPATKLIAAPPMAAIIMRFGLSSVVLVGIALATGRRSWRMRSPWLAPAGVMFGLNNAAFFFAVQHASIAVVSVIFALQPALVLLIAGPILEERPGVWHVAWTIVAIGGAALVVSGEHHGVHSDLAGIALAAVAMAALSGYHVLTRLVRTIDPVDPVDWMVGVTVIAWVALLPVAVMTTTPTEYQRMSLRDLILIAFIAVVVGVLGHTLLSWIHRGMPANRSAVYLLLFNVVAVFCGWVVNDEPLTWTQGLGIGIVLVGAIAVASRPPTVEPDSQLSTL
jgi:probable blue pigment (indigoidine) exporter